MRTLFFQESKLLFFCLCVVMLLAIGNLYIIAGCFVVFFCLIYFYRIPENKLPNKYNEIGKIEKIIKNS